MSDPSSLTMNGFDLAAHQESLDRLSPEQRQVVETWGHGMAVQAGAGSGKTTTLVVKCVELLRKQPQAKLCAVSFTERSAGDLREKLSARIPLPGHWVMTIHGLCGSIIRDFPRQAGYHGDERMLSEPEAEALWERAIETLWFDEIPEEITAAAERLLERESRMQLIELLRRVRSLYLQGALDSLSAQEGDPSSRALAAVGRFVLERYERLKRRRGALDFNDLENGADRALEFEEVRQYYHRRFDLVMVDEFQDTNPLQARIVFRFCKPDRSNLCVVGDPKQSIYRFRDADVSVFEDCCQSLPQRLSLTWNFRSRPGVIDFSNRVCAPAFEASQMVYEPLVPKREPVEGLQSVQVLEDATPAALARLIHQEMKRGVRLGDMALLLRKIRGKEEWLKGLGVAGIPIAVGSGGFFWEDPRVREMTALLKWWDARQNVLSGAVFMRAPWVGISDEELDQWLSKDPTLKEPFFASENHIAKRLKKLFEEKSGALRPGQVLMALLEDDQAETELGAPLLGLWHRAEELSMRGLDFHAVVQELGTSMDGKRRERDVPPPQTDDGPGQLMVLTVHASKGLEFPHVILLDLQEKAERSRSAPLLYWDRRRGAFLARKTEEGKRDEKAEADWRTEERRQELAESKRVFYVALTRARERLLLVYPRGKQAAIEGPVDSAEKDHEKTLKADHWRGWIEVGSPALPRIELEASSPAAGSRAILATAEQTGARLERQQPQPAMRPRHSVTEWNLLSRCPRSYAWTYLGAPEGAAPEKKFTRFEEPADAEITQRELGTRVHEALETLNWEVLRKLEEEAGRDRFKADTVIRWAEGSDLMAAADLFGSRKVWSETGFESPVAGEILVGSLDRLVRRSDGSFDVIDFKVTKKSKDPGELLASYETQLKLYVWALGRLEPKARDKTRAWLVNFSSSGVESVPVSLPKFDQLESMAENLAQESSNWVGQSTGPGYHPSQVPARPSMLCGVCEFRAACETMRS